MSNSLVHQKKAIAKKKAVVAAATAVGAVGLGVVVSPFVGVIGVCGAAYLGYDWIRYRIDNGLRF